MDLAAPRHRPWREEAATLAAAGLWYLLATVASLQLDTPGHPIDALRIGGAIMLAVLLRRRPASILPYLVVTFLACLAANAVGADRPFGLALGIAAIRSIELAAAYLALRVLRIDPVGVRDVRALASTGAIAVVAVPLLGGLFGGLLLARFYGTPLAQGWSNWALGSAMGMLVALPVLLVYSRERLARLLQRRRLAELAALTLLALAVTLLAILYSRQPFILMSLPLLLASLRVGLLGTAMVCTIDMLMVAFVGSPWFESLLPGQHPDSLNGLSNAEVNVYSALTVLAPLTISVILIDRTRNLHQLSESQQRLQTLADHVPVLIGYLDADGRYAFVNSMYEAWFGIPPAQFAGRTPDEIFGEDVARSFAPYVEQGMRGAATKFERTLPGGREVETSLVPHVVDGRVQGLFLLSSDISDRKRLEEALRFDNARVRALAERDHLTGLPNRLSYEMHLEQALNSTAHSGQSLALLYLDLDRFKPVNDSQGHEVGDRLLQQVAQRLSANMRGTDLVCRIGGDEFVVVLMPIRAPEDAVRVADTLLATIRQPFHIDGREQNISLSIGVAVSPVDGRDADSLVRHADAAMYRAKSRGGDQCCWHG